MSTNCHLLEDTDMPENSDMTGIIVQFLVYKNYIGEENGKDHLSELYVIISRLLQYLY